MAACLPVCLLDGVKVEVSEDGPEEGEDGLVEGGEVGDLRAEEEVAELREGQEHDGEHHEEAQHVLPALQSSIKFISESSKLNAQALLSLPDFWPTKLSGHGPC